MYKRGGGEVKKTYFLVNHLYIEVDEIYHLASPASPPHYMYNSVKTIKENMFYNHTIIPSIIFIFCKFLLILKIGFYA